MIIMYIFLFLTVVFIIGTAIYLNYKKKNYTNHYIKKNEKNSKEKIKRNKKRKLKNIFEIKIKDNIICLGNRYSNIIRLGNIDYNILSNSEQDAIENVLIETSLAIDYPVQFFSTTEFIDTSKVVSLLQNNKTNNINIKNYKEYLIEYLKELMENQTISIIKNYAIISYDGLYENAIDELNRKTSSFIGNLMRARIVCHKLSEDEIYNLIYRELNKNSSLDISKLKGGENLYVKKKTKKQKKRDKHI